MVRPRHLHPNPETAADNAFQSRACRQPPDETARLACYHTNVMLCVGTDFALGGFYLIADTQRRGAVRERLRESGRELIELDARQIGEFAGNALELSGRGGERLLALSERACASLSAAQKAVIERGATLLPLAVPTIELAGGSVRCMLAGVHLARR